jgi:uncharacterized protein (DUF1330 family)
MTSASPVYLLIEIAVTDAETYAEYVGAVRDVVIKYGGKYVVRGGDPTPLGGQWCPQRIVLIEFPSVADLRRCFSSHEYLELAPLRERSTDSRAVILRGGES